MKRPDMSAPPALSVVVATRNRPKPLHGLMRSLDQEILEGGYYELIVVDDGSEPPLDASRCPGAILLRTAGLERSRARNLGAEAARGRYLLFLDDDLELEFGCLQEHLLAHHLWPNALVIGKVRVPSAWYGTPFGRFRSTIDTAAVPRVAGPHASADYCTAQNMSVEREAFLALGGFDPGLVVSEDQDLGRRWLASGHDVAYAPDASVIHHDATDTLAKYLRRMEFGYFHMVAFARKYPDDPDNRRRAEVNGPVQIGREPPARSVLKLVKGMLGWPPVLALLLCFIQWRERRSPWDQKLKRWYRFAIGIAIQRGWRAGQKAAAGK